MINKPSYCSVPDGQLCEIYVSFGLALCVMAPNLAFIIDFENNGLREGQFEIPRALFLILGVLELIFLFKRHD